MEVCEVEGQPPKETHAKNSHLQQKYKQLVQQQVKGDKYTCVLCFLPCTLLFIKAIKTGFPPGGGGFPIHLDKNLLCKFKLM